MENTSTLVIIILALITVSISFFRLFVGTQNLLIRKKNQVQNAKGSVDAILKKRSDLIPNLINIVGKYLEHQKAIVQELNSSYVHLNEKDIEPDDYLETSLALSEQVRQVFSVIDHIDVRANQQINLLQRTWNEVEEQLMAARRNYNAHVVSYNNAIESFPGRLYAKKLNLAPYKVFKVGLRERLPINAKKFLS